jgi:hypothetical protein
VKASACRAGFVAIWRDTFDPPAAIVVTLQQDLDHHFQVYGRVAASFIEAESFDMAGTLIL